jgi:hypothetical protein
VIRLHLTAAIVAAAALAAGAGAATVQNECSGLMVCVPVAGPWVAIDQPAASRLAPSTTYQLSCPQRNMIVGGVFALVSDPAVDVEFLGRIGSPVNPGITTRREAVFLGTYVGAARRPTSFQPRIGCIPTSGGGGRGTTSRHATAPQPAREPLTRQAISIRLRTTDARLFSYGCARGQRLVSSSSAVAFHLRTPPSEAMLRSVRATRSVRNGRILVAVQTTTAAPTEAVEIQILAVCTEA